MAKIVAVVLSACLFATAGVAHALTFTLNSYQVNPHSADPGLVVSATNILAFGHTFDLDPGESTAPTALFKLFTDECCVNSSNPLDDTDPKPLTVDFNVSPGGIGQVQGETFGVEFSVDAFIACLLGDSSACDALAPEEGIATFGPPASLPLGDGTFLQIALSPNPTGFNTGFFDLNSGEENAGTVDATFSRTVPEPSALLLLGIGLIGAGLVGARSKGLRRR